MGCRQWQKTIGQNNLESNRIQRLILSAANVFPVAVESDGKESVNPIDLNQLAFLVCRGGWPRATDGVYVVPISCLKD